jgi:hypothetical protein
VKLTTHLQLVRGEENVGLNIHSPIRLHGVLHRDKFAFFIFTLKNMLAYLLVVLIEEKSLFCFFVVNLTTFPATETY